MNGWSITNLHLAPAGIKYTPMGTSSVIDPMTPHTMNRWSISDLHLAPTFRSAVKSCMKEEMFYLQQYRHWAYGK